jgi:S-DNA-T family DNA segregation ATPase FtsK/SpoIIIE
VAQASAVAKSEEQKAQAVAQERQAEAARTAASRSVEAQAVAAREQARVVEAAIAQQQAEAARAAAAPMPSVSSVTSTATDAGFEPRARDLVGPVQRFAPFASVAGLPPSLASSSVGLVAPVATTAVGRAFGHAAWVDQQLVRGAQPAAAPVPSQAGRFASDVGYPMVTPDGGVQPAVAGRVASPSLAETPVVVPAGAAASAPAIDSFVAPSVSDTVSPLARPQAPAATVSPGAPSAAAAASTSVTTTPAPSAASLPPAVVSQPAAVREAAILRDLGVAAPAGASPAAAYAAPTSGATAALPPAVAGWTPSYVAPGAPSLSGDIQSMPDIRAASGLSAAIAAKNTISQFVERLVGVRAALDSRVLPIELAPVGDTVYVGELVRVAEERGQATTGQSQGRPAAAMNYQDRADVARSLASLPAAAASPSVRAGIPSAPLAGDRIAPTTDRPQARGFDRVVVAPAAEATSVRRDAAVALSPAAASAPNALRPGGIAARSEQLAGSIGVRAAGVSIDFVDPARTSSLTDGAASAFAHLLPPSLRAATGGMLVPGAAAEGASERAALSFPMVAPAMPSTITPGQAAVAAARAGSDAQLAVAQQPVAPALSPTVAAAEADVARRIDAVWSLIRVFPAAAQSALAATAESITSSYASPSMPLLSASMTAAAQSSARQGTTPSPTPMAASAPSAPSVSAAPSGTPSPTPLAFPAIEGQPARPAQRPVVAEAPRAASTRVAGAPAAFVAPVAPSAPRQVVPALDRVALPDGRMPRGGYLWTRAASFTPTVGEWTPPATVTAASSGAEAASNGQPAWGGMGPVVTPSVQEAFGELHVVAGGAPAGRSTASSRGTAAAASTPSATGGYRAEVAAASAFLSSAADAPLLHLVAASAGGSAAGPRNGGSNISQMAQQFPLVQPPPPVASAPSSDSSAKILEAMRSQQQHAPGDDRITLADLTLVAAASRSGQLAASAGEAASGGGGAGAASPQGAGGKGGAAAEKKSPEAERREIEELARHVLDEVERMIEIARERSGDPWEA